MKNRFLPLILITVGTLLVFVLRAVLAGKLSMLYSFHLFDTLTAAGVLVVIMKNHSRLRWSDWVTALLLGIVVGAGMTFRTLYSPYPFLGLVKSDPGQAVIRALITFITALGGLAIMRQGGPVIFHAANGSLKNVLRGIWAGLAVGLPLAVLNIFALQLTQGQAINWQSPLAAMLDALQPGIVEETVYRFALWGLLWLLLRNTLPEKAAWLAGLLAMLVHNYSHFDELFLQNPLLALGMGMVLALVWGLPPLILARKRGLESAMAFHWVQDVGRFLAGF